MEKRVSLVIQRHSPPPLIDISVRFSSLHAAIRSSRTNEEILLCDYNAQCETSLDFAPRPRPFSLAVCDAETATSWMEGFDAARRRIFHTLAEQFRAYEFIENISCSLRYWIWYGSRCKRKVIIIYQNGIELLIELNIFTSNWRARMKMQHITSNFDRTMISDFW